VEQYIANYDKTQPLYIGCIWKHLEELRFASGGAGFFITNTTYNLIKKHLQNSENTKKRYAGSEIYGDVTFGLWVRNINRERPQSIKIISDWINLNIRCHNSPSHILKAVTFHEVVSESQFMFYDKYKYVYDYKLTDPLKTTALLLQTNLTIGSPKGTMMRHSYYKLLEHSYDEGNEDFVFTIRKFPRGYVIESKNYPNHFITPNIDGNIYIKEGNCLDNKWEIEKCGDAYKFISKAPNKKFNRNYLAFENGNIILSKNPCLLSLFTLPKLN
jgi:hypothetical protein